MGATFNPSDAALDAGVAAWFGVTKVEAERNFIRARMRAAVLAVLDSMNAQQMPRLRFVRKPEADRRIAHGDDWAGDAWLDTVTGQTVWGIVGIDRNTIPLSQEGGAE